VINLLVARLLVPADFGLFAIAFAMNELIGVLAAFSIPLAIIYLEETEPHLFDTGAWMMMALNAVSVLAAVIIAAVMVPGGLGSDAGRFLVILALSRVLLQMSKISGSVMEKRFRYRAFSTLSLIAIGVPNLICLWMAWAGFGPLALVGREVLTAFFSWLLIGAA